MCCKDWIIDDMEISEQKPSTPAVSNRRFLSIRKLEFPDKTAHLIFWSIALLGLGLD